MEDINQEPAFGRATDMKGQIMTGHDHTPEETQELIINEAFEAKVIKISKQLMASIPDEIARRLFREQTKEEINAGTTYRDALDDIFEQEAEKAYHARSQGSGKIWKSSHYNTLWEICQEEYPIIEMIGYFKEHLALGDFLTYDKISSIRDDMWLGIVHDLHSNGEKWKLQLFIEGYAKAEKKALWEYLKQIGCHNAVDSLIAKETSATLSTFWRANI